ncbi:MAG: hypothetical protein IE909_16820, partial [Campylobacterales bacterium]|nr:hypothetical protein [Campylobacterales bacterium]
EYINRENGEISHYFACENFNKAGGCNFSLWDNTIYKFFSEKGLELFTIHERADALKKILTKKKGYLFNGLIGKNKKEYDAKIYLEEYRDNTNQKKWGFKMSFTRKGKE